MALATTCPQCKTSFKVVPDQLKLRRGLVRCGVCQHVFSGIDYLRYVDDAARAAQRLARERAAAGQPGQGVGGGQPLPGTSAPAGSSPTAPTGPVAEASSGAAAAGSAVRSAGAGSASTPDAGPSRPLPQTTQVAAPPASAPPAAAPPAAATRPSPEAPPAASVGGVVTRVGGTSGTFAPPEASAPADRAAAPADPWAAAAHAAHERSLRDAPADDVPSAADPRRGAGSLAPGAFEPDQAVSGGLDDPVGGPGAGDRIGEQASPDESGGLPADADAMDGTGATIEASAASVAPSVAPSIASPFASSVETPGETQDAAPAATPVAAPVASTTAAPAGFPALPAPAARPAAAATLEDMLARPAAPWPTASGPQTLIAGDDDLKTAFFLPDTAFGPPLADEAGDGPRTVTGPPTRVDAVDPDPITRLRPEARPGQLDDDASVALRPQRSFFDQDTIDAPMPEVASAKGRREARGPERAIDYFPGVGHRSRGLGLALSPAAWIAATALTLLLGLQAVVGWRDAIAARAPFVAPLLGAVLSPLGAEIAPPREIDALTIEGFELKAAGSPNVLQLSAVLRNRSGHVVGYPAMELTLTDSVGALLVRKVIPVEAWLPDPAVREAGIAGGTERPLRLALEHDGLQPTGYAVALFYP